jgi:RNA polymerase primary sigma factor
MRQFKIAQKYTNTENDSFKQYLKDISGIPMFTPEEEKICTEKSSKGDRKAIDELVRRNLRFVVSVAKQYATENVHLEDLVNEGNIGLVLAAEKFTPDMGYKFISYAVWWVRKIIMEHISKHGKLVRIPANKLNNLSKLDKYVQELEQKAGRKVDINEVISEFSNELSSEDFMFLDVLNTYNMDSMDRTIGTDDGGNGSTLSDLISDDTMYKPTDHLLYQQDIQSEISASLDILKPRDKRVMEALFGLNGANPMTLKEIGDEVGITREMARQIKEKSLKKLRENARVNLAYNEMN